VFFLAFELLTVLTPFTLAVFFLVVVDLTVLAAFVFEITGIAGASG
jgi:hypothetical protein